LSIFSPARFAGPFCSQATTLNAVAAGRTVRTIHIDHMVFSPLRGMARPVSYLPYEKDDDENEENKAYAAADVHESFPPSGRLKTL
jgi:hypothetical protein